MKNAYEEEKDTAILDIFDFSSTEEQDPCLGK